MEITSKECVRFCVKALELTEVDLAPLVGLTEKDLEAPTGAAYYRVRSLYQVVRIIDGEGIHGKDIVAVLSEPVPGGNMDVTLLNCIVDDPNNILIPAATYSTLEMFT